jgi:hypothetical protein
MKISHIIMAVTFAGACACSSAMAWDQDPFAQYIQRSDTITLGAGDAKDVNAATHVIDPWPPYVGNRYIPSDGERMSDAVERYRDVSKLPQAPRPIDPGSGGGGLAAPTATGAAGGAAGGGAAPAR